MVLNAPNTAPTAVIIPPTASIAVPTPTTIAATLAMLTTTSLFSFIHLKTAVATTLICSLNSLTAGANADPISNIAIFKIELKLFQTLANSLAFFISESVIAKPKALASARNSLMLPKTGDN